MNKYNTNGIKRRDTKKIIQNSHEHKQRVKLANRT